LEYINFMKIGQPKVLEKIKEFGQDHLLND